MLAFMEPTCRCSREAGATLSLSINLSTTTTTTITAFFPIRCSVVFLCCLKFAGFAEVFFFFSSFLRHSFVRQRSIEGFTRLRESRTHHATLSLSSRCCHFSPPQFFLFPGMLILVMSSLSLVPQQRMNGSGIDFCPLM
jgi:hypothetical protein